MLSRTQVNLIKTQDASFGVNDTRDWGLGIVSCDDFPDPLLFSDLPVFRARGKIAADR